MTKEKAQNQGKNVVKPSPHVEVEIEKEIWDKGNKLSKPYTQFFDAYKGWPEFVRSHKIHGLTINKITYPKGVKDVPTMEEILGLPEKKAAK